MTHLEAQGGMRDVTRRGFVTALGAGGAALALGMAACSGPSNAGATAEKEEAGSAEAVEEDVANTYEADLVIVGSGMSGLAAAVQAGCDGMKTIVVERCDTYGGNASAVEGIFAIGDRLAEETGVEYTVADIVHKEIAYSNYRTNGILWTDLVTGSEENYYWMVEQGVKFSGEVSKGLNGFIPVAHTLSKGENGLYPYGTPMYERAVELGVDFRFNEDAYRLAQNDDGAICGVYARNAEGGIDLFSCKAVVLASGGFACNPELFAKTGWFCLADEFLPFVVAENTGAGYEMAHEVGAGDTIPWACGINTTYVYSLGDKFAPGRTISTSPFVVWVNQDGVRFVNEDFAATTNRQAIGNPLRNQLGRYVIVDRGTVEAVLADQEGMLEEFDRVVATNPDDLFVGDTIEAAAEAAGLDGAQVAKTLEDYNRFAAEGKDAQFLKEPQFLREMNQPPYYVGSMVLGTCVTFGGIMTNRDFEVVNDDWDPIPGLYAVGTDGCMLYRDTYTILVPTSAAAHHVHSGRHSAINAKAYIEAK